MKLKWSLASPIKIHKTYMQCFTHRVHQSVSRCRPPPGPNTPSWLWGTWSICWPGCAARRCRSAGGRKELRGETHKRHTALIYLGADAGTYRTHSGHHGVDIFSVSIIVSQSLTEEEVQLGIIGVGAVWDQVGVNEDWLWMEENVCVNISIINQ